MNNKRIVGKCLTALTLAFIIPQLVLLYLWEDLSSRTSFLLLTSTVLLIIIGASLIWDIIRSIQSIFNDIEALAKEDRKEKCSDNEDEFKVMGNSIEVISKKISQDMQALQHSSEVIEKTEKDLKEALFYTKNVMNSMGDALIVVGTNHKIKQVNRAASIVLNGKKEDFIGQTIDLFFEKSDDLYFSKQHAVTGKRMCFMTQDNKKIPVDVSIRPLLDPGGRLLGHVLVARDVRLTLELISRLEKMNLLLEETVQKRTSDIEQIYEELKMKDAQILQQEKMASIGLLATGIAHEINNPVGYINSNLEMLGKDVQDLLSYNQRLEEQISSIVEQDNRGLRQRKEEQMKALRSQMKMGRIARDAQEIITESRQGLDKIKCIVLDLKRFSHAGENKMKETNLNQEIQSTLNIVGHELKYKAKIVKNFGTLPPLICFPNELNQVFMNLLVNASQAIQERGIITINTFSRKGAIYVVIQDTGDGIPLENVNKIFDPFFTTKTAGKGTGLGLYLSYGIIKKHQGKISVDSLPGEGTTFTVRLPIPVAKALSEKKQPVSVH